MTERKDTRIPRLEKTIWSDKVCNSDKQGLQDMYMPMGYIPRSLQNYFHMDFDKRHQDFMQQLHTDYVQAAKDLYNDYNNSYKSQMAFMNIDAQRHFEQQWNIRKQVLEKYLQQNNLPNYSLINI